MVARTGNCNASASGAATVRRAAAQTGIRAIDDLPVLITNPLRIPACAADMNPGGRTPRLWAAAPTTTMGRPRDEQPQRMPPLTSARRRALARAALRARRRRADRGRPRRSARQRALAADAHRHDGPPAKAPPPARRPTARAPGSRGTRPARPPTTTTPTTPAPPDAARRTDRDGADRDHPAPSTRRRRSRPREAPTVVLTAQTEARAPSVTQSTDRDDEHRRSASAQGAARRRRARTTSPPRRSRWPPRPARSQRCSPPRQPPTQALAFYRIPLFLLPIYKAAAVQYGVPWQILAAINEIETDYGTDLSVSTRRRGRLDAVHARDLAAVRRRRAERRLRGPVQPGRRDLRRRALPARRRRRDRPARRDPRLQPLRRICRLGAAAREADLDLPEGRDRDADRA